MKSRENNRTSNIGLLFILLLFLSLVLCALFTMLIGSGVYENINGRMEENYSGQTALSYISNQFKQSDQAESIYVENVDGTSVMVLEENVEGTVYQTRIYFHEGHICEYYAEKTLGFDLVNGLDIIEAKSLEFTEIHSGLIKVALEPEKGYPQEMYLSRRSRGGRHEQN